MTNKQETAAKKTLRVLIVDDEAVIRMGHNGYCLGVSSRGHSGQR
jgi:hypothetical protein